MVKKALIMIDLQADFCQGGSLAVPQGDEVIAIANQLQASFDLIVATQDWHPLEHSCFAYNHPQYKQGDTILVDGIPQILWPIHCVQGSAGAEFHPHLDINKINKIIRKGIHANTDSYSAFFDNAYRFSTGLKEYLEENKVNEVYIMGLATDYCVKFSALDAVRLGFNVYVIEDGCRGVELNQGDIATAYHEMQVAGVNLINSRDLMRS